MHQVAAKEIKPMKTKTCTLRTILGLGGMALAAALAQSADLKPMVVTNLTGGLRIEQGIPCDDDVDVTQPVTQGQLEISPAGGIYNVVIPKDDFLLYEATVVNGDPESGLRRPTEDVTGVIDLTNGTVQMRVVIAMKIHFKKGCFDPCPVGSCEVCVIDTTKNGKLTANLAGTIAFPDSDGDGVPDQTDNCKFVPNSDQTPVPTPVVTAPPALTIASCADHQIGLASA